MRVRGAAYEVGDNGRLDPIAHQTMYERVYDRLRDAIMDGTFASGEVLTIRSLAQQLGTSVMPVREALRRLATEGALEILPNRSIRLPPMDADRIAEVCRLRMLLEGDAVALAAERATPAELEAIRSIDREFAAAVKAGAPPRLLQAGQRFHFAIYTAARSPTTLSIIGMLWLQSGPWLAGPVRRTFDKRAVRGFAEAVAAHHRELLGALEDRDPARATAAVHAELRDAAAHMRALLAGRDQERAAGQGAA